MSRLLAVACLLVLGFAVVQGDEIKGKVKKVDSDKNTLTITVADKDQTFNVPKDAKIVALFGKKLKKAQLLDLPGGLSAVKVGAEVTVSTTTKGDVPLVTQVKLEDLQPKKKKKVNN